MFDPASVRKHFDAAKLLDGPGLEVYLREHCPEPSVAREVRSLVGWQETPKQTTALPSPGDTVGAFDIHECIGEGGMGVVFRATQGFSESSRSVALKFLTVSQGAVADRYLNAYETAVGCGLDVVVPSGSAGVSNTLVTVRDQLLDEIGREASNLARLQHPGIAVLHDVNENARPPFLVMEYIKGKPIDCYCVVRRLSTRQRLCLCLQVCDAMIYAHREQVIHCDIKPSNILVTENPEAQVKILDFGIARVLHQVPARDVAAPGGTPGFWSPEQRHPAKVDGRTDVYSLGVLLFLLLTGQMPCGALAPSQVVETDYLARHPDAEHAMALAGIKNSRRLRWQLRGDLDAIILTMLQENPAKRYQSISDVKADIKNYLSSHPVSVRSRAPMYRGYKALCRMKYRILIVFLVAIVAGVYAEGQWHLSIERRTRQEQVTGVVAFLGDLFRDFSPDVSRGKVFTERELLDRATARIDERIDDPMAQWRLLDTLGRIYRNRGYYEEAQELLSRALVVAEQVLGPDHHSVGSILNALGQVSFYRGDHEGAERAWNGALEILENQYGPSHPYVATCLEALGNLYWRLERYTEAEAAHRRAIAIREETLPDDDPMLAMSLDNLALVYERLDRLEEAADLSERSLAILEKRFGIDHPDTAKNLFNLALIRADQNKFNDALALHERALAIREEVLPEGHPDIAQSLAAAANVLAALGEYSAAEAAHSRALTSRKDSLGEEHPDVARSLISIARLRIMEGQYDRAEEAARQAMHIAEKEIGVESMEYALCLNALADSEMGYGRFDETEELYERALVIINNTRGPESADAAAVISKLGELALRTGRLDDAAVLSARAIRLIEKRLGPHHLDLVMALKSRAAWCVAVDDLEQADALLVRGLEIADRCLGPDHPDILAIREQLEKTRRDGLLTDGRITLTPTL